MTAPDFHQQLLDRLESELIGIGCPVDGNYRQQMARLLDRMDQALTREDVAALHAELERELSDAKTPVVCSPTVWLRTVECA